MSALLLEALAPLLKKRDTYYVLAILVLAFLLWSLRSRCAQDEAALAARPTVHTQEEQQVKVVRVAGPVHVEVKTVYVPGTKEIQYVDRIVTRDPVTTTSEKESEVTRDVKPACAPAPAAPWRYAGVLVDPLASTKLVGVRGGVTLWNRLDLGASARLDRGFQGAAEAGIRF